MWKDFFFFSGTQRAGIIVLFALIAIIFTLIQLLPVIFSESTVSVDSQQFQEEAARFEASLRTLDSLKKKERPYYMQGKYYGYTKYPTNSYHRRDDDSKDDVQLFPFDPNTLDSAGLVELGIPRFVVSNILRYRSKGGFYFSAERFSETYGLSSSLYNKLNPFIVIESQRIYEMKTDTFPDTPIIVDLNTADSVQLMQLKGVRNFLARSILRFRKASGGFISKEQLLEVYGMNEQLYASISQFCTVDPGAITKLKVNSASVDKLRAHPYLDFYQAKALYEYRRKKGKLQSIRELNHIEELDSATLNKISLYLSFE